MTGLNIQIPWSGLLINGISHQEIEAIYRCISFSMDLRDKIEWENEKQYWSEWDYMTKHIDIALTATNKLAGYNNA